MGSYWKALYDTKLIGEKKFDNLMRTHISQKKMGGFIGRQLVETAQITKLTKMMLENHLADKSGMCSVRILPIKVSLSHNLREIKGYAKCREINNFHHAHDALLAAEVGRFILKRHAAMYDNPVGYARVAKDFIRAQAMEIQKPGRMPGSAGFIISSFLTTGFDKETGEVFKDDWDADAECERIRTYLNYKQVFVSRMPEETGGVFWDETGYSPRNTKKKILLPVKQGLDTKKYGGYSSGKNAFFLLL